ncbi:MAG: hypothetical protein BIFFINMI_03732 [Phycisphaerae bacterium]|nr:hypothetical protein [Phycisphaerae bacterium]
MDYTTLGRTGLRVSVMGLGGGGPSQLGRRGDRLAEGQTVELIGRAIDLGVNLIDTAESYLTEEAIGRAVAEVGRDRVVLATKKSTWHGTWGAPGRNITGDELLAGLDASLRRLRTEHVDIYQLHAVMPERYDHAVRELVPAMLKARDAGKIRFIGITEEFGRDSGHAMLTRALADDCWDTMMVGFSLLNPSARKRVFEATRRRGIGTMIMFAVRRALSRRERLAEVIGELVASGQLPAGVLDPADPLGWLTADGVAATVPEAAYRFARHESGADVVLSGTGDAEHLQANAAALCGQPLPEAASARLAELFGQLEGVSGN